jgi:hypothetical protein
MPLINAGSLKVFTTYVTMFVEQVNVLHFSTQHTSDGIQVPNKVCGVHAFLSLGSDAMAFKLLV